MKSYKFQNGMLEVGPIQARRLKSAGVRFDPLGVAKVSWLVEPGCALRTGRDVR